MLLSTPLCVADIWQWTDGDEDGSLWLSDSFVEPYADLSDQLLWWAELPYANLHHANLTYTNLSYANLIGASLKVSEGSFANLSNANLDSSILAYAEFVGANFEGANVDNANMFYANFSNANLEHIVNWNTAFWLAARYNANTIFPEGMDPNDYAMIELEIPAPGAISIFFLSLFQLKHRRSANRLL